MGTRKRLQRVFLDCFAPVLGLPDHRRGSKTRPFCGRRIKNVCLLCVLFVCTFCVPFVVVVFKGQQDIPDVLYTMDGKFGYNPSGLSVSVPSICTERHVDIVRDRLNKKVPDSFRSTLVVTDTSPVLAVDPFLSIGFPIYHALSTDTLRAFLRCNGLPLTKVILYNLPIDRVQAIVKSSLHDRRRTVSYTVLYTDGTDVDFSEHEHTENRMLVVGNEVDRFVTTATVDAGQHARSYFSHIDPLVPSQPLFAGVKQSVVDKNIHVGVFDAHLPVQQLQTQLWAACTHGKRYVVHAFLDDKFERIRGPFEMCDNPIFWHSKTIEEPLQHMLMTAMDVHICPNAVRNGLVLSAFGQGIPVIAEEGGHVMPSKDALGKLLTYRKSSTGYEIRESLERVELAQRHHDLKQRILTFAATFNDAASGQWDEMVSVGITQSMRSMLYCAHNEGRTERNTRLLSSFGVSDWADDSTAKHHTPMSGGTVLFIASELGGISPGGAGILIRSIIIDLLVAEVHIIILFDTTDLGPWEDIHDTFDQIRLRFRRELFAEAGRAGDESSLRIIALQTVAKLDEYTFEYDESIAKSLRWAQAIETVYLMHRFDMVEVFDFTGAGSALLLRRLHGRSVLPQDVIVAVRIHGTFELISAAENAALNMVSFRRNNLERFALTTADVVLYPGAEIIREYRKSLAIVTRRDLEGVPPLLRALKKYIKNAGRLMPWKQRNILVLGKVQRIKGVFQIVEGISQLMLRHPELTFEVHFVGQDAVDLKQGRSTVEALKESIARASHLLLPRFKFLGLLKTKDEIVKILPGYRVAIVGSLFETFCLSAHELHQYGMPLIMANIPVFAPFREGISAFKWDSNSIDSFVAVVLEAVNNDDAIRKYSMSPRIQYRDPIRPYRVLLDHAGNTLQKMLVQESKDGMTREMCTAHHQLISAISDSRILSTLLAKE